MSWETSPSWRQPTESDLTIPIWGNCECCHRIRRQRSAVLRIWIGDAEDGRVTVRDDEGGHSAAEVDFRGGVADEGGGVVVGRRAVGGAVVDGGERQTAVVGEVGGVVARQGVAQFGDKVIECGICGRLQEAAVTRPGSWDDGNGGAGGEC